MAASLTMTASFLSRAPSSTIPKHPFATTPWRSTVVAKATRVEVISDDNKSTRAIVRRNLVVAAATVAACSIAKVATAEEEPKPGTPEAKKKYAPVCVTMPTARVCHK